MQKFEDKPICEQTAKQNVFFTHITLFSPRRKKKFQLLNIQLIKLLLKNLQ
jgi:hypothetical protein